MNTPDTAKPHTKGAGLRKFEQLAGQRQTGVLNRVPEGGPISGIAEQEPVLRQAHEVSGLSDGRVGKTQPDRKAKRVGDGADDEKESRSEK